VSVKRIGRCRQRWTSQGWVLNYLYLPTVNGKPYRKRHVLSLKAELKRKIDRAKEGDTMRKRQREHKIIWGQESSIVQSAKNECMNEYFANRSITGDDRTTDDGGIRCYPYCRFVFIYELFYLRLFQINVILSFYSTYT
jgi:hypothetical protein